MFIISAQNLKIQIKFCHRNQIFAAGTKIKIQYETTLMETDTHAIKNNGGFYLLKMYRYIQIKILFIW